MTARLGLALALVAGAAPAAFAQDGRIAGVVVDKDTREPLEGVEIVLRHTQMGNEKQATTDAKGRYRLVGVRFGDHEVRARKDGYKELIRTFTMDPASNDKTPLNIELTPLPKDAAPGASGTTTAPPGGSTAPPS